MDRTTPLRPSYAIAISAALPLGIWLSVVAMMSFHPSSGSINITSGRATFRDHCGACHILEKNISTHHGPNLFDIGRIAASRKPDRTAAEYILESILDPDAFVAPSNRLGMPRNLATHLSPDEIRNIVAFLASRGASPNYREIMELEIPDMRSDPTVRMPVRLQEMELAESVLRGKGTCLNCHSLHRNAEHQVFAPGLFGVGLTDKELVKESIIDPYKVISPAFHTTNVILKSGNIVSGTVMSRTDDQVVLFIRDKQGQLVRREIPLSDVEEENGRPLIEESKVSMMPKNLDQILTNEELEAVINLIHQLN